uniref:6,7-dimethyl-8-ribityllumazine synthase n=1 Tax=Pararhizobium sp. IMCC3301 TaxID=3067904 RepID=UPI002740337E|nr:6,7-dimethyl-8-ribityllumazine synthase [Pararhizobium sp. IMCC3301]
MADKSPKILIIEARFYEDIADELIAGAIAALEAAGIEYDRIAVPGVLEIPAALSMALIGGELDGGVQYDGFVTLGCVIRGETTHYDIVAGESARALMDLAVVEGLALGNGIQTVENTDQAWARAKRSDKNKGGGAAAAAIAMIRLRSQFGLT